MNLAEVFNSLPGDVWQRLEAALEETPVLSDATHEEVLYLAQKAVEKVKSQNVGYELDQKTEAVLDLAPAAIAGHLFS